MEAQLYNEEINVECQCSENSNGTYNILYIAPEKGHYKLAIKIFHQHVKGSPFSLNAVPGARVTFRYVQGSFNNTVCEFFSEFKQYFLYLLESCSPE